MALKTSPQLPPNWDAINAALRPDLKRVVITYGDTVYNVKEPLPTHLEVHESVHAARQTNPIEWWDRYLTDVKFRLEEELLAYGAQYAYVKKGVRASTLEKFLFTLASDLHGPMYGNLLTHAEAESKIRNAAKQM